MNSYIYFLIGIISGLFIASLYWQIKFLKQRAKIRKDAIKRSSSVIRGRIYEEFAPYFPDFPFSPSEVRFLGKPIDFIAFEGIDDDKCERIVFVEVKTGKSRLSSREKSIKDCIIRKKVDWFEYKKT